MKVTKSETLYMQHLTRGGENAPQAKLDHAGAEDTKPRYWRNPRPTGNRTGKARNIYLDDASFEEAKRLGDGSASLGIKRAIAAKSS